MTPALLLAAACNDSSGTPSPADAGLDTGSPNPIGTTPTKDAGPDAPTGPASASISTSSLGFGNVDCGGAQPADQTFTVTNKGGGQLTWSAQLDNATYFDFVGTKSGTLAGGESATVTVKALAMPSSANAGDVKQATVAVTTSDPIAPLTYLPVSATAQGATLTVTPGLVTFGDVPVQATAPEIAINIKNTGNAPATIAFAQPANGTYHIAAGGVIVNASTTVAAGATSAGVAARFQPTAIATETSSSAMTVTGAVCGVSANTISLTGRGVGGVVGVSPGTLDYGLVNCGTTGAAQIISVLNTGTAAYNFTTALAAGASSPYVLSPSSGTVLAGSQASIIVTPKAVPGTSAITPNLLGDTLTVTTTATGDTPHTVALMQTASGAILTLSATPITFGVQTAFVAAPPQSFDVINSGNVSASVTVTSTNADYVGPAGAASVAAGSQLARAVTFTPSNFPASSSTMAITTSTPLCAPLPAGLAATGSGIAKAASVAAGAAAFRRNGNNSGVVLTSACAVVQGGRVVCWGDPTSSALVPNLTNVTSVASGGDASCAVKGDGTVWCWGALGGTNRGFQKVYGASPVQIVGLSNAIAVGVSHKHACALTAVGTVYCWGDNAHSQLGNGIAGAGNGHDNDSVLPTQVANLTSATQLTVTTFGGCALASGVVNCWGGQGKLNYGSQAQALGGFGTVVELSGGGPAGPRTGLACARYDDGTVTCWGDGSHSKLGNNSCVGGRGCDTGAPGVTVSNVTTATGLSVGGQGGCVLLADQSVQCWGRNTYGEVGTGTDGEHGQPTTVPGVANAVQVSSGYRSACARLADSTVMCWGDGGFTPTKVANF